MKFKEKFMSSQTKPRYTVAEYLALERKADRKSEYIDGEIFAMVGASKEHNLIAGNIFASLHSQLKGRPCNVFQSDMRVQVSESKLYSYPDVVVVCGEAKYLDEEVDTLLNPTMTVEVLSKSTESFDRGEKAIRYRSLNSLMEYILVAQDRCHVEQYVRQSNNKWLLSETNSLKDTINISSINCALLVKDIYDRVEV
jgi:Uma2 family endonuclease